MNFQPREISVFKREERERQCNLTLSTLLQLHAKMAITVVDVDREPPLSNLAILVSLLNFFHFHS